MASDDFFRSLITISLPILLAADRQIEKFLIFLEDKTPRRMKEWTRFYTRLERIFFAPTYILGALSVFWNIGIIFYYILDIDEWGNPSAFGGLSVFVSFICIFYSSIKIFSSERKEIRGKSLELALFLIINLIICIILFAIVASENGWYNLAFFLMYFIIWSIIANTY